MLNGMAMNFRYQHIALGLFAILGTFVAVFFIPSVPFAEAVTISPVRLELAADPGSYARGIVKITNDEPQVRTLFLDAANFESNDESGEPKFIPGKDNLAGWVRIQESVTILGLQSMEVPFTVEVPSAVDPGGYFAAIFASVVPATPQSGGEVALRSDVGTLLFFRVNGDFKDGETILEFRTKDNRKVYNSIPVEFMFRFQNDGDDRALPVGDITVRNVFGKVTKVIPANPSGGNVLPQSVRRFETAWVNSAGGKIETNKDLVVYPEFGSFFEAVKYQVQNFALGHYNANLELTINNDSSRQYAKSTSFWIIPWQLLVVVAAIIIFFILPLLLLIIVLIAYLKRRQRQ